MIVSYEAHPYVMPSNSRRNNRNKSSRSGMRRADRLAVVRGTKMRTSPDPPSVNLGPWYPYTVVAFAPTVPTGSVDVSALLSAWQSQTADSTSVVFRIHSVMGYAVTDSATAAPGIAYALSIQPYSIALEIAASDISDLSSRLNYPHVGYKWSLTDQQLALFPTNNRKLFSYTTNSAKGVTFYIRVWWRFNNFTDPPSATPLMAVRSMLPVSADQQSQAHPDCPSSDEESD